MLKTKKCKITKNARKCKKWLEIHERQIKINVNEQKYEYVDIVILVSLKLNLIQIN